MINFSMVIACKQNHFDFWNSCKRLENFVNGETLHKPKIFYKVHFL